MAKTTGKTSTRTAGTVSIPALRGRDNSTESKLPTGQLAEVIELMEQVIGTLDCLETFANPNVDLSLAGFSLDAHIRSMALTAGSASRLVTQAQRFLIDAEEIEREAA